LTKIEGSLDSIDQEIEARKQQFFRTIKNENWGRVLSTSLISLAFLAYFIQLQVYNVTFKAELSHLQEGIPIFFNRFRYTMLGYAFMRERILYNNTLGFFESDPVYGQNIDLMNIDLSMENER